MTGTSKTEIPEGYKPGLEGVIAGLSSISQVNPDLDALIYRGYKAHELAEKATFEEVAYLLLLGKLPNKVELKNFQEELLKERKVSDQVLKILAQLPSKTNSMVGLQLAITLIHMLDPDANSNSPEANLAKSIRLIAKTPTLISALHRISLGKQPVAPNPQLDHASNFLFMMSGQEPVPEIGKIFSSSMVLYAEHGYNASTFAGLVTASTLSDMHSSVVSAIGALKGPLHGGANERAIEMLLEIGESNRVEPWLKNTLSRKEKVMGFGHRVYKKQDSRAPFMKKMAAFMAEKVGDSKIYPLSVELEEWVKKEKDLFPNVDYHGAVVYYLMGLPTEVYTPIFAMSRMPGWTSHIAEQHAANRLIRPKCIYTGETNLSIVPIDQRS